MRHLDDGRLVVVDKLLGKVGEVERAIIGHRDVVISDRVHADIMVANCHDERYQPIDRLESILEAPEHQIPGVVARIHGVIVRNVPTDEHQVWFVFGQVTKE
jgi:hypothetical protein